jgi:hypothetical protein
MVATVGFAGATDNASTINVPWTKYGTSDPIEIADGDVAILAWNGQSSPTWTAPSGWTLAAPEVIGSTGSHRSRVYVRALDGTEDANPIELAASGISKMTGILAVYRGVDPTDIIDAIASRDETTSGTSHANPQVTTVAADAPVVTIIHERLTDSSTAYTAPTGYTKRVQPTPVGGGGSTSAALADDGLAVTRAAATDVTPPNWTNGASTNNVITWTISLTPAAAAPSGTGSITATAALSGAGTKATSGTGSIAATGTGSGTGSKSVAGTGSITATSALAGAGTSPALTAPEIPVFTPGVPVGTLPAVFNAKIRDPLHGLLAPACFIARNTGGQTLTENTVQAVEWDRIDEDPYEGWDSDNPSRFVVPDGWFGWWQATAAVSLSGTGASNLVLIPSIAVNSGQVNIGVIWEGQEAFVPTGSGQAKIVSSSWWVMAQPGDIIELLLYFSDESSIAAVDTTAGLQCRLELIWDGV